jgi:hypothetical protein
LDREKQRCFSKEVEEEGGSEGKDGGGGEGGVVKLKGGGEG